MLPDRVSNPGPLTYESGALVTDCATRPGIYCVYVKGCDNIGDSFWKTQLLNLDTNGHILSCGVNFMVNLKVR